MSTPVTDELLREGYLKVMIEKVKLLEAEKKELTILGLTNILEAQRLGATEKQIEHLKTAHKINIAQIEKQIADANKILNK